MVILHHLNNSRSQRILWLLEELAIPYEIKHYQRDAKTMLAPPELKAIHPLGKSPVITDAGKTIAETGAIIEYLIATYGNGRFIPAANTDDHLRYTYWLHFAEGSAMPPLVMTLLFGEIPKRMPALLRPIGRLIGKSVQESFLAPMIAAQLALMEQELAKSTYFAGDDLTGADIIMSFPIEAASAGTGIAGYPKLQAWLTGIHARPAYQTALKKGGPYAYA